jgi:hypothetical protein
MGGKAGSWFELYCGVAIDTTDSSVACQIIAESAELVT